MSTSNTSPLYGYAGETKATQKDETDLLRSAVQEIKRLRTQNEILMARLSMFDQIVGLVRAVQPPQNNVGMWKEPDILHELENFLSIPDQVSSKLKNAP